MSILNFIKQMLCLSLFACIAFSSNFILGRSHLRKNHEKKPRIEAFREKTTIERIGRISKCQKIKNIKPKVYFIASKHLEKDPIFNTFDKKFFDQTMLPEKITYRYDKTKSVTKKELDKKLENLVLEIKKKKRSYKDFKILKQDDFNRRDKSGLIVVKFKDYPFVAKLFIESPKSFVNPYSKGLYPALFYKMNGGIGRHHLGFTRIKNLHYIREKILSCPKWSKRIEFPRKWHWVPKDPKNIKIIGKNFEKDNKEIFTIIPGIYCIIADEIKLQDTTFSIFDKEAREECMSLCNFLDVCLDPHIDNFLVEQGSGKIALIDTENFRAIVGLKGKQEFSGYVSWIYNLALKGIPDLFFKPKKIVR